MVTALVLMIYALHLEEVRLPPILFLYVSILQGKIQLTRMALTQDFLLAGIVCIQAQIQVMHRAFITGQSVVRETKASFSVLVIVMITEVLL